MHSTSTTRNILWDIKADVEAFEASHQGYVWGDLYGLSWPAPSDLLPEQVKQLRNEFVRMHDDFREVKRLVLQAISFADATLVERGRDDVLEAMGEMTHALRQELAKAYEQSYPAVLYHSKGSHLGFSIVPVPEAVHTACDQFAEQLIGLVDRYGVQRWRTDGWPFAHATT